MSERDDLLAWIAARGDVTVRNLSDAAPRQFRRAAAYGPLVAELLASGRLVEICTRPRTFRAVDVSNQAAPTPTSTGARILAMLDEAAAEFEDLPDGLADYWAAVTVRDRLVERLRVRNGAPVSAFYSQATAAADEAVTKAFGIDMEG